MRWLSVRRNAKNVSQRVTHVRPVPQCVSLSPSASVSGLHPCSLVGKCRFRVSSSQRQYRLCPPRLQVVPEAIL
jgi:hypothetical protein